MRLIPKRLLSLRTAEKGSSVFAICIVVAGLCLVEIIVLQNFLAP